jgi:hypothetical protein
MRTVVAAALGMLSLVICSSGYANITVQNTARHIAGANPWEWSIYLAGSPQEMDQIHCVTYHLHPTFPNPIRQVCDNNPNPQHAFVLSTKGWGTFVVKVDVLFKDGTVFYGQHLLSFSAPISAPTLLASMGQRQAQAQAPVPPSTQQALASPRYVLTVGNMTPFDGISTGPNAADTDYLGLSVKSSSGETYANTIGPNVLRKSSAPTNWNLSTPPIAVPDARSASMTILITVTNRGHFGNIPLSPEELDRLEKSVRAAVSSAVAKGITAAGAAFGIPIPDQISQALAQAGVALVDPNCDAVLFSPVLTYDGAALNQGPPPGWFVEGPNKYHVVLDYGGPGVYQGRGGLNGMITIPPHCDTGVHYNIELHLTKMP